MSTELISKNHQFDNCSQVWLAGDHYKWRAMRVLGVSDKYITGMSQILKSFKSEEKQCYISYYNAKEYFEF